MDSQVYFFVGFDGLADSGQSESTGVRVDCSGSTLTTRAFWNTDFTDGFKVSPGDHLTATSQFVAPSFVFTVTDTTNGHRLSKTVSCPYATCPRTSVEVVSGLNSNLNDDYLSNYGRVTFSKIGLHTSHGKTGAFSSTNWTNVRVNQQVATIGGLSTRAKVSAVSSGGTVFADTWISEGGLATR